MKEFIVLMASLMSIVAISIDAMLPALGVIGIDLGVTHPNQPQYVIAFIFLGMALGQMVAGPFSDSAGRKKTVYFGLAFYAVGSAICYFANSLEAILIGRLIQGFGVSGPYVASVAIVRDRYSGRDMARIMSLVMMIFILVPAIAPTLGQFIMGFASWRAIFLMYMILAFTLCIWIALRLPETLAPENRIKFKMESIKHGFGEVVKNRVTLAYTICIGFCFGSFIGYLNSAQQIFMVQFGVGEDFSLYFGGLALVIGFASMYNSRVVQRLGMRFICKRATQAIILSSAIFLVINIVMPVTVWMFVAYAAVLFFSFGLMFGNLNSIAMEPMGHIAGIAAAVIGCFDSIISTVLGTVIGQLYDGSLIPIAAGFLVLNIVSLGLMFWAERVRT